MDGKSFPNAARLRVDAEDALSRNLPDTGTARSADQTLHELQVHQIELEMQNEALREAQVALERSRERYVDLYEFAPVGYLTLTDTGIITEANLKAAQMLGVPRARLIQLRFAAFVAMADRDGWHMALSGALRQQGEHDIDVALTREDGSVVQVNIDCRAIAAAPPAARIAIIDVTAKKRAEKRVAQQTAVLNASNVELRRARDAAESASAAKSAFLANMSHELRTPLNAITGMTYLLRRSDPNPQQMARIGKIESASAHLLALVERILELTRVDAEGHAVADVEVDVVAVVDGVASASRMAAQAKGLQLASDVGPLPAGLWGDVSSVRQALANFVDNAIRFSDAGTVVVGAGRQDESADSVLVRFEVRDSGPGLAPEVVARLFLPFEQADNSMTRRYGGLGIGLHVARKLARRMGGDAGVESVVGKGSTFWFTAWLRKHGETVDTLPASSGSTNEALLTRSHRGRRLLVVDDDPGNRIVTQGLLQLAGQVVDVAVDGDVAVEIAKRTAYDLILMDLRMPRVDGFAATRQIRALPNGASVPIIALTAASPAVEAAGCFAAGMNDVIGKPVDPDLLYAMMIRWLARGGGAATDAKH